MKFLLHWRKIGLDLDGSKTVFFLHEKFSEKKNWRNAEKDGCLTNIRFWNKTLLAQIESKITVSVGKKFAEYSTTGSIYIHFALVKWLTWFANDDLGSVLRWKLIILERTWPLFSHASNLSAILPLVLNGLRCHCVKSKGCQICWNLFQMSIKGANEELELLKS